ncbi:hypothetical protein HPB48_011520 [Haemaphysalis longicornis]|uniref:Uncharacterized protein n=1 Tax=Haemaphysalis longicornis TaxID=44386 RepID=A0A9J6G2A2_HAELO|nr:hypothetical protein HPB48_011520 [Haemaphysalis longicornis]
MNPAGWCVAAKPTETMARIIEAACEESAQISSVGYWARCNRIESAAALLPATLQEGGAAGRERGRLRGTSAARLGVSQWGLRLPPAGQLKAADHSGLAGDPDREYIFEPRGGFLLSWGGQISNCGTLLRISCELIAAINN